MLESLTIHRGAAREPRSMRDIMALRDRQQAQLREHPFFAWFTSSAVPLEKKFDIMPVLIQFVMAFRDMNLWVIRFGNPDDVYKKTINGGTVEDETHSRLFLEDWRKLHQDDRTGWQPSDVLWWLFLAEDMEAFREYSAEFMRLCVDDGGDPLVRFAHFEAAEAGGNVFFSCSAPLAEQLAKQRGLVYRYFGQFHLALETGHVVESEDVFQDVPLSEQQYVLSVSLVERSFKVFQGIYDTFLRYGKRYVETGEIPKNDAVVRYTSQGNEASSVEMAPSAEFRKVHPTQRSLEAHLRERTARAAEHPFYAWLTSSELPAIKRLQRFIPLWAFDAFAYRDLNRYFLRYEPAKTELERSVNAIADTLESHSQLFLQDWQQLGLDKLLRWPASDTLGFFYLDPVMDIHRRTLVEFGMVALGHRDAFHRLWFIEALEATGFEFFSRTRQVALAAEAETGIRLDYLADRHASVNPEHQLHVVNFKNLEISDPERLLVARRLVDRVFDALDQNLSLSLEAARQNKLSVR